MFSLTIIITFGKKEDNAYKYISDSVECRSIFASFAPQKLPSCTAKCLRKLGVDNPAASVFT